NGPALFWSSVIALFAMSLALVMMSGVLLGRVFQAAQKSRVSVQERRLPRGVVGEGNPYEWLVLKGHAPSLGALTHFSILFFLVMLLVSLATPHWQEGFSAAFFTALAVHLVSKLHHAIEATRQINTDQQSGAMELLLVSTLPEAGILQ